VLMLGPVVLFFTLREHRGARIDVRRLVPWFIIGFIALAVARSLGFMPEWLTTSAAVTARWLTVGAMAALGLSVDVRTVRNAGARTCVAVAGSLIVLFALALTLIHVLQLR